MSRKKIKRKSKQIVVTKEKLQKVQETKQQVVAQVKTIEQEVKTTDFYDKFHLQPFLFH